MRCSIGAVLDRPRTLIRRAAGSGSASSRLLLVLGTAFELPAASFLGTSRLAGTADFDLRGRRRWDAIAVVSCSAPFEDWYALVALCDC